MKINITKKQYWDLMRGMYIADWIANAVCNQDMEQDNGIKEARDYIFSFAKEVGYGDFAEYDKEFGEYYATSKLEDGSSVRPLIERYDEHVAWDEISEWIGERDFYEKYTEAEIKEMSNDDFFMKQMECQIEWEKEFEEFGIERLGVVRK